jgi:hypothetical protein
MSNSLKIPFQLPVCEKGFYLLENFFQHSHDSHTANFVYAIPWESGIIFVPRRDPATAGCVGCVVRRLVSTIYHKSSKIACIDSVFYSQNLALSEEIS